MKAKNYDYKKGNYPIFSDIDIVRLRDRIVMDAYWDANNLKDIIEKVYDTSRVYVLPNQKHEVVFSLVALTCELYFKSLIYSNKNQMTLVHNHDLLSLFTMLPETLRRRLIELTGDLDCENKIAFNKDVFVHFRYSYEMKGYRIDATFLLKLMNSLATLCLEIYPQKTLDGMGNWVRMGHYASGISYRIEIE